MKKLILLLGVLFLSTSLAFAQSPTKKGSAVIDGSMTFQMLSGDAYEFDGDGVTHFLTDPFYGYFIMDNLAIGGSFLFDYSAQGDVTSTQFGVGPTVIYYIAGSEAGAGSLLPFVSGSFIYTSMSIDNGENTFDMSTTNILLQGGVTYMLNDYIGLNGSAFFSLDSFSPDEGEDTDGKQFGLLGGLTIFLY